MSCISSNFSSFFLDSLNDPSEFAKYLGNGENKMQTFDDFQVFGGNGNAGGNGLQYNNGSYDQEMYNSSNSSNSGDHISQQQSHHSHQYSGSIATVGGNHISLNQHSNFNNQHHNHHPHHHSQQQQQQQQQILPGGNHHNRWNSTQLSQTIPDNHHQHHHLQHQQKQQQQQQHLHLPQQTNINGSALATVAGTTSTINNHHFDGSFEFLKYLRHTSEYSDDGSLGSSSGGAGPNSSNNCHNSLIDLDSSTSLKSRSIGTNRKSNSSLISSTNNVTSSGIINRSPLVEIDSFDHDSKHTILDLHHQSTNSSNSNESSSCTGDAVMAMSSAFTGAHSNSNTSSEGGITGSGVNILTGTSGDNSPSNQNNNASKTLINFSIKENFDVHPAHRVEEGIFQHMNKLPAKKKETLKQLGVRFTGQMTLADKSIVVENFIKFCQEYKVTDHRPFLSLNQSGLNKPEQIKFARYLGQGLPAFTLFCIYSNFKNLFCTKRTETYIKDGYNLNYILDKTKRHLSCTTAGGTPIKPNPQYNNCNNI